MDEKYVVSAVDAILEMTFQGGNVQQSITDYLTMNVRASETTKAVLRDIITPYADYICSSLRDNRDWYYFNKTGEINGIDGF